MFSKERVDSLKDNNAFEHLDIIAKQGWSVDLQRKMLNDEFFVFVTGREAINYANCYGNNIDKLLSFTIDDFKQGVLKTVISISIPSSRRQKRSARVLSESHIPTISPSKPTAGKVVDDKKVLELIKKLGFKPIDSGKASGIGTN